MKTVKTNQKVMIYPLILAFVAVIGTTMFVIGCYGYEKKERISFKEASLKQNFMRTKDAYLIGYGLMFMALGYGALYYWLFP